MAIKSSKQSTKEGYKNIKSGQTGDYRPLRTRYEHLNKITHGGLARQKIYTIGALSSFGKSHVLRQIEVDIFDEKYNPTSKKDCILIKCDWEQTKEEYILTKVHEKTGKDFEYLMYEEPDEITKQAFNEVYIELTSDYIFETFNTYTPDNFYNEVIKFIEPYRYEFTDEVTGYTEKIEKDGKIIKPSEPIYAKNSLYKKQIVLTVDNMNLVDRDGGNESDAIANLITHLIALKREVKTLTIILLAQLNRNLKERINPKEHFPRTSDFFNSSKIEHASDIQLILHNPYLLGYQEYGAVNYDRYSYLSKYLEEKNKYAVFKTKGLVFFHYVKVRLKNSLKDFRDVFVEEIFEVDENDTEVKKDISNLKAPVFTQPDPMPIFDSVKFNTSPKDAFEISPENKEPDGPF